MADKLALKIGRRITACRKLIDITSEQLAYENDISKGYLSDIENGRKLPSLKMLEKIAKALGVEMRDLL